MEGDLKELKEKVDQIHKVLLGNGEPEKGLAFKVAQHAEFVGFWKRFGWAFIVSGLTIPPGVVTVLILNMIHIK